MSQSPLSLGLDVSRAESHFCRDKDQFTDGDSAPNGSVCDVENGSSTGTLSVEKNARKGHNGETEPPLPFHVMSSVDLITV